MSDAHPPADNPVNPAVRYERTDASFKDVLTFGVGLAVICVACAALLWGLFVYAIYHENAVKKSDLPWDPEQQRGSAQLPRTRPGPLEPGTPQSGLDPKPRLEKLPDEPPYETDRTRPGTAQQQRKEEEDYLNSTGWVDRKNGVVHIPIEQAMAKVAGQLPVRKGPGSATDEYYQAPSRSSSGRELRGGKE
jgi:hypothetical protein